VIDIVSDCSTTSSPVDSGLCVPVCSSDVAGNTEPMEDAANLCASRDSTVTDKTTDDTQSPLTSITNMSNTVLSVASALGEHSPIAAGLSAESVEAIADTDLTASASSSTTDSQNVYHVKWIKFHGSQTPIVMQNQNGPCPLLAIVNVLLLQGKIKLSSGADLVASDQLMAYIADWIFDNVPKVCCVN